MPVALQIRDVPEHVRDLLAQRAAERNQSLQAYLLGLVEREAQAVRNAALFERTARHRVTIPEDLSPEHVVREGRDEGFTTDRHGTA